MIRVVLFGMLRDKSGQRELSLDSPTEGRKLSDVVEEVKKKCPKGIEGPLVFAINEEQAGPDTIVKDGDEVAIMPPFSGG